ncbi:MAG TPA: TonB-dependent receptor [Bryobacteraceae bacterium]|nr:TonB-dependent receptor [Bryobacteraceae bacterium]
MRSQKKALLARLGSLLLLAAATAHAQTANITGTILDATGASVSGATVTATHQGTGNVRTATTDNSGTYAIPNLAVGNYDVSVEKQGFATLHINNVELTVAQNLTLNGTLEVGGARQTVEVVGSTVPPINLEDAQISNVIDSKRVEDLPLITRDPYQLVLLSPGSQQVGSSLGGFSVNGQRERNNNFLLDGLDNNDASVPGIPGGISSINPDSTQEFRVITNNFLPEFGRNTGAIIDVVTRSGSNQFHGDAYEFNRVNALAARDWFNSKPDPQNPFVRNQFGASLGGPVVKDRTFFFVNSEWDRFRTTLTNQAVVPTAAFKTGVFNYDGQQINLADPGSANNALGLPLSPTMQKVLSLYPNPNGPAVDSIRGIYFFPTGTPQNNANVTFKVDQRIGDKYTLSARYIYNGLSVGNSLDEFIPGLGGVATGQQSHNGAINFIAALRPNLVNEFRGGLNRTDDGFTCNGVSTINQNGALDPFGFGTDYAFANSAGVSLLSGFGCGALGDSNGQARRAGTWNIADSLSWIVGRHSIKVGGEFRYIYDNGFDAFGSRPTVDFTAFGNFGVPIVNCSGACGNDETLQTLAAILLGVPGIQSQTQFYNAQGTRRATDFLRFVQHEYGAFVQDSWKARNNLTLEFGLRYEFFGVPFERDGNFSNLLNQQANDTPPITFQTVGPGTGRQLYRDDSNDFEPRVGLAWDPFSDGKTSVRLGYGIFHDRIFGNLFENLRGNPPFIAGVQNYPNLDFATGAGPLVTVDGLPAPPTQPGPGPSVADGSYLSAITILDPNLKTPYTQAWNVGVQRELGNGMTIEVDYVGSGTHRLARSVDGNPPLPWLVAAAQADGSLSTTTSGGILRILPLVGGPQVTGNQAFVEPIVIRSIGNGTYNGLQTTFRKRFGQGLDFQAAYTWSHAIDDAADPLVAPGGNRNIARNSFNLKEERGSSDYDLRHRLIVNFLYDIPLGQGHKYFQHGFASRVLGEWELSGLSTFQSGHPMSLYSSRDSEYTGLTNKPDLVGNPSIPSDAPRNEIGPPITAFAVQPFGRPGSLGRNTFTGPRYYDTDVNLSKNIRFTERIHLQFRTEVYNLFNRIQFDQLNANADTLSLPGTFGLSLNTLTQPDGTTSARQVQFAMKLIF